MNSLILTEPTPQISLVGGGKLTLAEPLPLLSATGSGGGVLVLTEPIPSISLVGYGGSLSLTEPLPTIELTGQWNSGGTLSLTEPIPVFALTGNRVSGLKLTEPVPKIALTSRIPGRLVLSEPLPTIAMRGDNAMPGVLQFEEPVPILRMVAHAIVTHDAAAPDVLEADELHSLDDYTGWSVNAKNAAHSGFTNYQFSSLLYFQGRYYGTRDDGLFELIGETDDGAEIPSKNVWGPNDYGTPYPMRFHHGNVELRNRNNGKLTLTIEGDEENRKSFEVDPTSKQGLHNKVVRGRRDLKGTEFGVELANVSGGDFDVPGFEIVEQILPRRK